MPFSINEILNSRSKEEIEATLDYFNALPLRRNVRKQDLVKQLSAYLSAPGVWLSQLMESDLRLLQRLCKAGPGNFVEVIPPDFPPVVEVLHFVEAADTESEDYVRMSIPIPFYDLIANDIDDVISRKELDGSFEIEHFILGAVNFYGVVPLHTFVSCLFEDFTDLGQMREFAKSVSEHPIIRLYQESYKGEAYLVSPYVEHLDELMQKRKNNYKFVRKYASASREEAVSCGVNSPFCFFGGDTREGKALLDLLYAIGYEGEALLAVAHSVWINSQYEPDEKNLEMLLYPVSSVVDEIRTLDLFKEYVNVILNYANKVPKWLLKGRTAEDTGLMRYTVDDPYLEKLYGPEMSESENEKLMQFFDKVHKVHPVGPDDPCPCGSGFSYRFCHGKYSS